MTMIEVEPQPRIDTLVRLPGGGEARRTEYTGTAWFDGKPQGPSSTPPRPSPTTRLAPRPGSRCTSTATSAGRPMSATASSR
jgi:hypothetical protein